MPECQSCGAHVSKEYARVTLPTERSDPESCPHCPDLQSGGKRNVVIWRSSA